MSNKLLVGSSKGLIVFENKANQWSIESIHFLGMPISYIYVDKRNNTWWASIAHRHWGQKLQYSIDEGQSWQSVATPKYPSNAILKKNKKASLKKIWSIAHAGQDKADGLWIGTEPGGLFYSDNNGQDFELVNALWNHPSRLDENQWFGAGRDHPFIHSIVVDPRDSNHVYIAVSCAGVFETKDGGQHWQPCNKGLIASYLPNPNVEVGHDPHLLLACPSNPDVLWQQNHCGIFRSTNGGQYWNNITDKNGIANYGFALAIDETDDQKAWVIPAISDEVRVAHDLALRVYHTNDGGQHWEALTNGLPQENCFDLVLRHGLVKDKNLLAFGTNTGKVYLSDDEGMHWQCLSGNLARVDCICFA